MCGDPNSEEWRGVLKPSTTKTTKFGWLQVSRKLLRRKDFCCGGLILTNESAAVTREHYPRFVDNGSGASYNSSLPLSSGIKNTVAIMSRTYIDASRAIATLNEYFAAKAPTANGPGAPTARPTSNK